MYYYNPDKRTGRVAASIATLLYFLMLAALFLLVRFTLPAEQELGNGMLIDFGTVAEAGGETDPSVSEVDQKTVSQPTSAPQPVEPQLTSDDEEAPEIAQQQKKTKPQPTQTQQPTTKPAEQSEPAPQRQVNQRALFTGRTQGSTSPSEGMSEGAGNQGEPGGSPEGGHEGMGQGSSGSFDLAGRGLIGRLPGADYPSNYSGKVVVEITVDREGRVTKAVYREKGSTTNAGVLRKAAEEAALKARFTPSETNDIQVGTITYVFKLK